MKSKTYDEFVEKFKPRKTTDDCYTPPSIYAVVRGWACKEYGIDPDKIVRPFYPGEDYERFNYPEGAVVLDNPPFSILSKICTFYLDRGIPFFLFAPSLTCFSGQAIFMQMNHLVCDANIVYENGAVVKTSFVTSYGGDIVAQTAPKLTALINAESEQLRKKTVKELPKYTYPDHVISPAIMQRYAHYGIDFKILRGECVQIGCLDAQKPEKKKIFGSGLLLSDRLAKEHAAAERAAAERAAAVVWSLSEREKEIASQLK
nr:MAG TPA: DNA N-6-adenine-methyltransferase [Caudoviricetes sp.]